MDGVEAWAMFGKDGGRTETPNPARKAGFGNNLTAHQRANRGQLLKRKAKKESSSRNADLGKVLVAACPI